MHTVINVEMFVSRKADSIIKIIVMPGVILTIQSLSSYFIQINSDLRIQFTTSILLSLILYLVMVIKLLPIQSEFSNMEQLFLVLTVYLSLLLILIICNYWHMNNYLRVKANYDRLVREKKYRLYRSYYKRMKTKHRRALRAHFSPKEKEFTLPSSVFNKMEEESDEAPITVSKSIN